MENEEKFMKHIRSEYNEIKISSRDVVIGCKAAMFLLKTDYSTDRVDYDGHVLFSKKGKPKDIKLVYAGESEDFAERIYDFSRRVRVPNILPPCLFGYCLQEFGQDDTTLFGSEALMKRGFWGLCYDKYETSLVSWSKGVDNGEIKGDEKATMKDAKRCLTEFWRRTICDILITISHIHGSNLYHGALDLLSSYVFFNGELTLIKVEYCLDDYAVKDKDSRMMQDFKDFKNMLAVLLKPNEFWDERDHFLRCFDDASTASYSTYLKKLVEHPFLMDAKGRMDRLSRFHVDLESGLSNAMCTCRNTLGRDFLRFKRWQRCITDPLLLEVYDYAKKNSAVKTYVDVPRDLLRFLRNLNEHLKEKFLFSGTIDDVDELVRASPREMSNTKHQI